MSISLVSPFPADGCQPLWQWLNSPPDPNWDDFTRIPVSAFGQLFSRRRTSHLTWGIHVDGELIGYIGFRKDSPIAGQFQGMVIAPEWRAKHIGREALALVIALLREEGIEKFLAFVFADNHAVRRAFEACGFAQEGYLTGLTRVGGKSKDVRLLSLPGVPIQGD